MTTKPTHFKYICRVCKSDTLQPVLKDAPEKTAMPSCCGSRRNMAYVGVHFESSSDAICEYCGGDGYHAVPRTPGPGVDCEACKGTGKAGSV